MIDRKETPNAHVFKVVVSWLRKKEVKGELEDDRILLLSGEIFWGGFVLQVKLNFSLVDAWLCRGNCI